MELEKNIKLNNEINQEVNNQEKFIETTFGKTINLGLDIGLRAILPDLIENEVIEIKNTILEEGFSEGINKIIKSAIDFGKSAIGIVTGNFENISQVKTAVKNGGIIDSTSDLLDIVLNKINQKSKVPNGIISTIKQGKNVILSSISSNIEEKFNNQLESTNKLENYVNNWTNYYNNKDFNSMTKEIYKIKSELKNLIPMESIIRKAKSIENLHNLIKNNGKKFDLTNEEKELAKILI